ncbi:hypothetical protein, partial [Paracoccus versutus]|uniref:hypothetical protein n=1 Tax=Paracoccus versutus TaxID=34007 RepID=UPI001AD809BA
MRSGFARKRSLQGEEPASMFGSRRSARKRKPLDRPDAAVQPVHHPDDSRPPMPHLLSIDQGTTSSRAMVFDAGLRPIASAQHEFPQHYPA